MAKIWEFNALDINDETSKDMNNRIAFGKNTKDRATEQALRRLKYLHTSLTTSRQTRGSSLKPLQTTNLAPISTLESEEEDGNVLDCKGNENLSLQPKHKKSNLKVRSNTRLRLAFRPSNIKTHSRQFTSQQRRDRPAFSPISTKKVIQIKEKLKDRNESQGRTAKSAPASNEMLDSKDLSCPACLAHELARVHNNKEVRYYTNMKINQVTVSARPQSEKNKKRSSKEKEESGTRERGLRVPETMYGGWGVRAKEAQKHHRDSNRSLDVAIRLQTLKLAPKGPDSGGRGKGQRECFLPPPTAPPTPVRQIDIKMPEGYFMQFSLQTAA
ncbi:predicted protein [Nematostella vectensis]|uniref:Uncharacterized protein n=1 Tax=Nematostella vectensis TaxID=45351 RepID=A7SMU0_NEMVE|nr:uncharacterized protein LOC5506383 [Nematostella vectensis]EDO34984.1 predicted protein [Nematostella vectensis]|eukprot:XP_001627084.1 predicted protein [Nematostella vectensis]